MFTLLESPTGQRLRAVDSDNGLIVADKPVSSRYVCVDVDDIRRKLEASGANVETRMKLMDGSRFGKHKRTPFLQALVVRLDLPSSDEYRAVASILLPHTASDSIKIAPGAMSIECTNFFTATPARIRHTHSERLDYFMRDPYEFVKFELNRAARMVSLMRHAREIECDVTRVVNTLAMFKPRWAGSIMRAMDFNFNRARTNTLESLAHVVTEPHIPALEARMGHFLENLPNARMTDPGMFGAWLANA